MIRILILTAAMAASPSCGNTGQYERYEEQYTEDCASDNPYDNCKFDSTSYWYPQAR